MGKQLHAAAQQPALQQGNWLGPTFALIATFLGAWLLNSQVLYVTFGAKPVIRGYVFLQSCG